MQAKETWHHELTPQPCIMVPDSQLSESYFKKLNKNPKALAYNWLTGTLMHDNST